MKRLFLLFVLVGVISLSFQVNPHDVDIDDNDFAEFEEFDDEEEGMDADSHHGSSHQGERPVDQRESEEADVEDDDDGSVEIEDEDEFEHFEDEDEFEGFSNSPGKAQSKDKLPDLKITKIPLHLRTNWDSFYMEMMMLAGLGVYFLNFLAGKNKNHKLAQAWLAAHKELLDANFAIVGDDGTSKEAQSGVLMKESENVYALWCSGRTCVEGMLVELKFLKRQDLVNVMATMFKPASDQILITVNMDPNVMDKFVFCIAHKRTSTKLQRDVNDLNLFCPDQKNADRFDLPGSYKVLSEIGEATSAILDKKVCQVLTKYEGLVEYLHFSDQYSGAKSTDDSQPTKMPTVQPVLKFCFNVSAKGKNASVEMESLKPLLQMVIYCIDKISRLQLNRESKNKAEKNRKKAEEVFLKAAHSQRQEAAQQRREEKHRVEQERFMSEEDPDKARKLEEKESRREAKRKQPKMKMMKVKAM